MTKLSNNISARVAALFACHFFAFGLFLPFFPLVMEFRGLSAAEIGLILGIGTIARTVASPILSNIADWTSQRRLSILVYSTIGAGFISLFFLPGGVFLLGGAVIGYMVIKAPVLPLSDAYALDAARNTGADYARMRLWGSVGFVLANLAGGSLAGEQGSWMIVSLTIAASLATGIVVLSLPRQPRDNASAGKGEQTNVTPFAQVWFWPVLAVLGLFQATHAAFYGFGTIYWQSIDVPDFAIGVLWAIGVVAEIALFAVAGKLSMRFDPPMFLIAAGIASVVRWGLFPFADSLIFMGALQLLHGFTFGAAHLGAVAILAKVVPARWSGTGQGLFTASIGIQMAAGLAIAGSLFEADPHAPFYLMSGVAAAGLVAIVLLAPLIRRQLHRLDLDGNG
ncbi:MFS transporter [uncultured Roseibium sp.]|uniref:MFS transporter n=1 Tax=uncultured Roseibium sp. TaxID=1936171 RepID=UPI002623C890|nr:MFS transporter [uncultured Roseibium sp.]